MSNNPLLDAGGISIFESLRSNHTIQNLYVKSCCIGDDAGQNLAVVLPTNKGLRALVITSNEITCFVTLVTIHRGGMDGSVPLIAVLSWFFDLSLPLACCLHSVATNTAVLLIRHSLTPVLVQCPATSLVPYIQCSSDPSIETDGTDSKLEACAKAMYNDPSVTVLDISSCNVHASDAVWLKKNVLLKNTVVWKLDIGNNPINDAGCNAVAQSLKKNLVISTLRMNSCEVGDGGGEMLAEVLLSQKGKQGGLSGDLLLTGNPSMGFVCLVKIHRASMDAASSCFLAILSCCGV